MLYRKFKFNWFARPLRPVGNATWRCGICAERQCLSFPKVSLSLRSCSFGSFISCFQGPNGDVNQLLCRADPAGRYPGLPLERALPMDGMGGMMQKGFKLASSTKWAWGLQVGVTTCTFHYIPLHSTKQEQVTLVCDVWKSRAWTWTLWGAAKFAGQVLLALVHLHEVMLGTSLPRSNKASNAE